MGETWFIKQATRKSKLASQFTLELLKEQDVVEAKPTTPKAKTIRRGENVKHKNSESTVELSDDPPSGSEDRSIIEMDKAAVKLHK